jgi:hypothetical protein
MTLEAVQPRIGRRRGAATFDTWWWLIAVAIAPVIVFLNRDAHGMSGILPNYRCFRTAILAGMNPAADHCASTTFPMWGYGWILAVTQNQYVLLVGQSLLAIAAAVVFLLALERVGLLHGWPLRLVKALLVVSLPWYAQAALRWPYSEAASLILISIGVLAYALSRPPVSYRVVALSGVLFGLALNFRSDYVALVALVPALVIALVRSRTALTQRMGVWVAATLLVLTPWMVYSYRATHHVLLTSTNSGHVLYISLGQLPDNPWGIKPFDADPRMHRELDAHFGRAHVSSLTYESDKFLRGRFLDLVRQHPGAWLRKDARNAWRTLTRGFYLGEFPKESPASQSALLRFSNLEARLLSFFGFFVSTCLLFVALRRRDVILALVAAVPVYQLLTNTFGYQMESYSSNVYVFVLALLGVAVARIGSRGPSVMG